MSSLQKASVLFILLLALVLAAWWGTVQHMVDILWSADVYSHGLLVPVISLWLIWRNSEDGVVAGPPAATGAVLLLPISLLWVVGEAMEAAILQHLALVFAIQALFLACFGWRMTWQNLFPLFFLFFMVPFGGGFVKPLQILTTDMVTWGLDISGVDYQAEGVLIRLANGLYEVAEACAGLKFLFTSIVTGVLLCYIAFESWWRRATMLLASFLVPIIANAGRVYTTLLIAEATDQDFAKSIDHVVYGWVFLSFVLLILIAGAYRFSDRHDHVRAYRRSSARWSVHWWHGAALLPMLAALWMTTTSARPATCDMAAIDPPGCADCDYRVLPSGHAQSPFELLGADASHTFLYRRGATRFLVYAALFAPDRADHRMVQGAYQTLRDDWLVLAGGATTDQRVDGVSFSETVVWRGPERQLVWRAHYTGGAFAESGRDAKISLGLSRLKGNAADGAALIIATDMRDGIDAARDDLRKFLSTFPPERFLWTQLTEAEDKAICAE